MIPVNSTSVHAIGYDPETSQMHVIYKSAVNTNNPSEYKYVFEGVPADIYSEFLNSKSKGRFNGAVIKPRFKKFSKVRRTPPQV